jgi:hypothetical protein
MRKFNPKIYHSQIEIDGEKYDGIFCGYFENYENDNYVVFAKYDEEKGEYDKISFVMREDTCEGKLGYYTSFFSVDETTANDIVQQCMDFFNKENEELLEDV